MSSRKKSKLKVVTIVGARPQFVKAAIMSRGLKQDKYLNKTINEVFINTGQHYDHELSKVFFNDLKIKKPNYEFEPIKESQIHQLSALIEKVFNALKKESPDSVILYGDTNSTLAGAIAANSLNLPIIHLESGERIFRRFNVPEESNRIIVDNMASFLLTSTKKAYFYLKQEGFSENRISFMGDPMYELFNWSKHKISHLHSPKEPYHLCTLHRVENITKERIEEILEALSSSEIDIVLPAHPRLSKLISDNSIKIKKNIKILEPKGYFDFQKLLLGSQKVITDSGGVTREAFFGKKECLIPMENSWWQEIEDAGWAKCFPDLNEEFISHLNSDFKPTSYPRGLFGQGDISTKGWRKIANFLGQEAIEKNTSWHSYGVFRKLPKTRSNNLTYLNYSNLLKAFKNKNYKFEKFSNFKKRDPSRPSLFLRHDIDISTDKAIDMARLENKLDISSTYFFMVTSSFYNLFSPKNKQILKSIISLGHRIGLHFDVEAHEGLKTKKEINLAIKREVQIIEGIIGDKIDAVSFHRPNERLLNASQSLTSPLPHTYMKEFIKDIDYCSDSTGSWRFGSPLKRDSFKTNKDMHLLVHPIWWEQTAKNPFLRLQEFILKNKEYTEEELKKNTNIFRINNK